MSTQDQAKDDTSERKGGFGLGRDFRFGLFDKSLGQMRKEVCV